MGTKGLLKTDNSGRSWRGVGGQQLQFASIDFVNGQSGWGIKDVHQGDWSSRFFSGTTELVRVNSGKRRMEVGYGLLYLLFQNTCQVPGSFRSIGK